MSTKSYHEQYKIDTEIKLRERIKSLPAFSADYFRGIEPVTSIRTRMAYAYDLGVFFDYLKKETKLCGQNDICDLKLSILDKVTPTIIQDYLDYLKVYNSRDNNERSNGERGLNRKLSSIRSFYKFFFNLEMIKTNPAAIVRMPKIHQKNIIRLEHDEIGELLDEVESGKDLTKHQSGFHKKTKVRDMAILTLLLGTGIRVSECVGLDINDIDLKNHGIRITRKGGNQSVVYFGDEVEKALVEYLDERDRIVPMEGHENALFLSIQNRRICVRSVENLVKKYSCLIVKLKKITPHKLRSTYGTQLYKETGDIYLVADVLGHSDVNTTKKHYAAIEDTRRRLARNAVTLRDNAEISADNTKVSTDDTKISTGSAETPICDTDISDKNGEKSTDDTVKSTNHTEILAENAEKNEQP